MEVIGYISAIFVGILLGLLGGGGSILAVPIFIYLFGINPTEATSYSLLIVFIGALISFIKKKNSEFEWKDGIVLAIGSSIGVFIARSLLLPNIPDDFELFGLSLTRDGLILTLFLLLALSSGIKMVFGKYQTTATNQEISVVKPALYGVAIGALTAFVGAGGGFLIVPTLNIAMGIGIKKAIVISLMVISVNSFVGVISDLINGASYDFGLVAMFSLVMLSGIFIGTFLSDKTPTKKLKKIFGLFVIALSVFILLKEII